MRRRQFVTLLGTATVPLAGCAGGPGDAVVAAAARSPGTVEPVPYGALSTAEQRIARTASTDGSYHACPELPDAVRSFATQFEDIDEAYLRYDGTVYGLWIRIEDTVRAATADPPAQTPSCGLL